MTVITSSPTQFGKLLDLQRGLFDQSIAQTIHADVNGQVLRNIREITHAQLTGQKENLQQKESLKVEQETLKVNKKMADSLEDMKELLKLELQFKIKEEMIILLQMKK